MIYGWDLERRRTQAVLAVLAVWRVDFPFFAVAVRGSADAEERSAHEPSNEAALGAGEAFTLR